jgi:hypothetical protein
MKIEKYRKIFKIILYLAPFFILGWLINKHFAPSGKLTLIQDFNEKPSSISEFYPKGRMIDPEKNLKTGDTYQRIIREPAYFDVKIPRLFKKATVTLTYKTSSPILELGLQKSKDLWAFDFKPIGNKFIDDSQWFKYENKEKGLILLEKGELQENAEVSEESKNGTGENLTKNKNGDAKDDQENEGKGETQKEVRVPKFENVDQFLANLPKNKTIAQYNINLLENTKLEGYEKSNKTLEINHLLRGKHNLVTYIEDEGLNITFDYIDINRQMGPDRFNVYVRDVLGRQVFTQTQEDDGNEHANGVPSALKTINLSIPNLPEGVYWIDLDINNDFVITHIKTSQKYLFFKGRVFLADNFEYEDVLGKERIQQKPTTIYATANKLKFRTSHPKGFQKVLVENSIIEISETQTQFEHEITPKKHPGFLAQDAKKIYIPKNNLITETNGYIFFDKEHYFGLSVSDLTSSTNLTTTDFIMAKNYESPKKAGSWMQKTETFEIRPQYVDDGKLKFIISGRELKDDVLVDKIEVTLEKDPITIKNFWSRLKNYIKRTK